MLEAIFTMMNMTAQEWRWGWCGASQMCSGVMWLGLRAPSRHCKRLSYCLLSSHSSLLGRDGPGGFFYYIVHLEQEVTLSQSCCNRSRLNIFQYVLIWSSFKMDGWKWKASLKSVSNGSWKCSFHHFHWWNWFLMLANEVKAMRAKPPDVLKPSFLFRCRV